MDFSLDNLSATEETAAQQLDDVHSSKQLAVALQREEAARIYAERLAEQRRIIANKYLAELRSASSFLSRVAMIVGPTLEPEARAITIKLKETTGA